MANSSQTASELATLLEMAQALARAARLLVQ